MQIDQLFAEAIKIADPTQRAKYLDDACADNPPLRARVEALLAAHNPADSFLESPAPLPPSDPDAPTAPFAPPKPLTEAPGSLVGRYKLLQNIGEGGMGVVYMAEQEKPVRRRIALKIIKPGMDSAQVIARFEAERQALAMMDHPNIARVLDVGTTDTGRPYFVMELVQGIPITKYCDDKQLDTHARLELFVQVCHAVQHAHQKGIIHRDLKPSNILIATYDAKPIPKIIDFGVAKALHQRLTEKTMYTQFGAVVGTLEYMSPEQADMDLMGTDTRSDIYSLGVLLYELLTGTTPLDGKQLRSLGYAEMLKTIREVEPPKPSTRLTQSAQTATDISAKRQTEPRRLQKLIAGDLDWIVMKCLEKDRTRRYETANGLAIDIQRHLHDEAVSASPPGQLYRLQKLIRRNKLLCAATASVILALVIGLAASLWQAERAAREANRASQEAERARDAEHHALATLNELRDTAPTFVAEARALSGAGQFDQAIEKLNYAAKLQPGAPEHPVAIGDLCLCQLKLPEAAAAYHRALLISPGYVPAQEKAKLCDELLAAPLSPQGKLSLKSLAEIFKIMEPGKSSDTELKIIKDAYADEKTSLWLDWRSRLKLLPVFAKSNIINPGPGVTGNAIPRPGAGGGFDINNDGQLILFLDKTDMSNLSQLKDLPIVDLYLSEAENVADVQVLAEIPSLENLTVPLLARNIEALRKLPRLKRLAFNHSSSGFAATANGMSLQSSGIPDPEQWKTLASILKKYPGNVPEQVAELRHQIYFDSLDKPWYSRRPATTVEEFWKAYPTFSGLSRLRDSPIKPNEITRLADGTWNLNFDPNPDLTDISFLQGMPISVLTLGFTSVADLSPLKGMPLRHLKLYHSKVADLTPLKGMQITLLDFGWTNVKDVGPIKGMPLNYLSIDGTPVSDLTPLRGMPLTTLKLRACPNITSISALADVKELTQLVLPPNCTDVEVVRTLPKLQRLSFDEDYNFAPDKTADEFWAAYVPDQPWLAALRRANFTPHSNRLPDKSWSLSLDGETISDLSAIKGANITQLSLMRTAVADLSPLSGMKLTELWLAHSNVTDLTPLKGMPIARMNVSGTDVSDLTPLIGMPLTSFFMTDCDQITDLSPLHGMAATLENVILPKNPADMEFLRAFPKLKRIGYKFDGTVHGPDQTAAEFWAQYDRTHAAPVTKP